MASFIVSDMSTFKLIGLNHHSVLLRLSACIIAWALAFLNVLIGAPLVEKTVNVVIKKVDNVRL